MKVVVNRCFGGFGLSHAATLRYYELKGQTVYHWFEETFPSIIHYTSIPREEYTKNKGVDVCLSEHFIERNDPFLVQVVEEFGKKANGDFSNLKIVEIPDDIQFTIEGYSGQEWVAEAHQTWY